MTRFYPYPVRLCAHVGCKTPATVHGVCATHYKAAMRAGVRSALGGLLSPSLHPARRVS